MCVCVCTSVAGDHGIRVSEVTVEAVTDSNGQFVALVVFLGVEDVLPAVSTRLETTANQRHS